jgi:hypothetical protein
MILHSYQPGFIILNGPISFLFNLGFLFNHIHLVTVSNIHKDIKKNYRPSVITELIFAAIIKFHLGCCLASV